MNEAKTIRVALQSARAAMLTVSGAVAEHMAIPEQTRDEDHASTLKFKQLTQDLKQANRLVQQLVDALNLMEPVKKFTRRPAGIEGCLKVTAIEDIGGRPPHTAREDGGQLGLTPLSELEEGEARWTQLLAVAAEGIDKQDFAYLSLLGEQNTPHHTAKERFIARVTKDKDYLAACKRLSELYQKPGQGVESFAERVQSQSAEYCRGRLRLEQGGHPFPVHVPDDAAPCIFPERCDQGPSAEQDRQSIPSAGGPGPVGGEGDHS